jgi:hypothetical protein
MTKRFLAIVLATGSLPAQVDVLTRRMDTLRSGVNSHETALTQQAVRTHFGKLWTLYADAKIMAQPLYVSNLKVPSASIIGATAKVKCANGCNAVIFATMRGTIYAYMADEKPTGPNDSDVLLWASYLSSNPFCNCNATGPHPGNGDFDMWAVDDPSTGILGTPVIDRATDSIYAVDWTSDEQYRLYRLKLSTGQRQADPVVINGTLSGVTFNPNTPGFGQRRKQRAGLMLSNGLVYVAFGGDDPKRLTSGWLFVYDAATLTQKTIWTPAPGINMGGIWMAGDAPAVDSAGNIYLQSGNGMFEPSKQQWGDAILKLQMQANKLSVTGWFAPCNEMLLNQCDLDQGSAGLVLFDQFVVGGGKDGRLYLMRQASMPGNTAGIFPPSANACMPNQPDSCTDPAGLIQKFNAATGHIHGSPIVWKGPNNQTLLFVMGEGDRLKAYPFEGGKFNEANVKMGAWKQPPVKPSNPNEQFCQVEQNHGKWMPGGLLGVSSNGTQDGIVWALVPINGDANSCRGVRGMLLAVAADDVTQELWRSQGKDQFASDNKDSFGTLSRFDPPTIANGKVFVPTAGAVEQLQHYTGFRPFQPNKNYSLTVYGLK